MKSQAICTNILLILILISTNGVGIPLLALGIVSLTLFNVLSMMEEK